MSDDLRLIEETIDGIGYVNAICEQTGERYIDMATVVRLLNSKPHLKTLLPETIALSALLPKPDACWSLVTSRAHWFSGRPKQPWQLLWAEKDVQGWLNCLQADFDSRPKAYGEEE